MVTNTEGGWLICRLLNVITSTANITYHQVRSDDYIH
jgi:hypothetical protein